MKTFLLLSLLVFTVVQASPGHGASAPELMAALSVEGYGYRVKVLVNGTDIGIRGGKSESRRLFSSGHPLKAQASPNLREHNFPLTAGVNEVTVDYAKVDPKSEDRLEIVLEAEGYPQPLLKIVNRRKASDRLTSKVVIESKAPPDFKPVVIGDIDQ